MIRNLFSTRLLLVAILSLVFAVAGCELDEEGEADATQDIQDTNTNPATASMSIGITAVTPSTVTIRPGGTVTFNNDADREVIVDFADTSIPDTAAIPIGGSASVTFPNAGSFSFVDLNVGDVAGIVVVE